MLCCYMHTTVCRTLLQHQRHTIHHTYIQRTTYTTQHNSVVYRTLTTYAYGAQPDTSKEHNKFSIASYNVLLQQFATKLLFPLSQPAYLRPIHRQFRLRQVLSKLNTDIICLQECETREAFDRKLNDPMSLANWLYTNNYQYSVQKKNPQYANIIAYKTDKFTECIRSKSRSRTMYNTLVCKDSKSLLYIGNIHLISGQLRAQIRFNEIRNLCRDMASGMKLDKQNAQYREYKQYIVLCGDFNSNLQTDNAVTRYLQHGTLDSGFYDSRCKIAVDVDPRDNMLTAKQNELGKLSNVHAPATQYDTYINVVETAFTGCYDMIYVSNNITVDSVMNNPFDTMRQHQGIDYLIPGELQPSDHLPIAATLMLT